ncbi:MAG: hypothetical protein K1Y36_23560 [Blastocatellia bacterium]|nr:hypothetical protein [Blastocatellia bacterium]
MVQHTEPPQSTSTLPEKRLDQDTPITAEEAKHFERFYKEFLGKHLEDRMAFLKAMALCRRGDLREFVQTAAMFQGRYKQLMPSVKQRDLLLSYPTTTRNISNLIFDFDESYGGIEGVTTVRMAKDQVTDHLDRTEMFRLDTDKAMESVPSMLPEDLRMLQEFLSDVAQGKPPARTFRFLLVILADYPFLSLIPGNERGSTQAIGKIREFLDTNLGESIEDVIVEFFVVGGGFMRYEDGALCLGGHNNIFDPQFLEQHDPAVAALKRKFEEQKFALAQQILTAEIPNLTVQVLL